jgi:hypothetical protein
MMHDPHMWMLHIDMCVQTMKIDEKSVQSSTSQAGFAPNTQCIFNNHAHVFAHWHDWSD